jgi:hypothetical protein
MAKTMLSLIAFLGPSNTREPAAEIVCVVADAREVNLKGPLIPLVYVPLDQVAMQDVLPLLAN